NNREALHSITDVCKDEGVTNIVMGQSVNADGKANLIAGESQTFAQQLTQATDIPVAFIHEGFSSFEAARVGRITKPVANPRRQQHDTGAHDDKAAAIILQRYLDTQKH